MQITSNIQRELNSHELLKKVLVNKEKLTFIFDVDGTLLTEGGHGFEPVSQDAAKSEGPYKAWQYMLEHSYPQSLEQFKLFRTLRQLNQGIGVATTSDVNALLKLKLAGIDLNDLDFAVFLNREFTDQRILGVSKDVLEVNNPDVIDLATFIEAISNKYKIRIGIFETRYEKRKALDRLCKASSEMRALLTERKIVSVGDHEEDGYLAYRFNDYEAESPYRQSEPELFRPVEGGLGLMTTGYMPEEPSSKHGSESVSSLGVAAAYVAAVVTNNADARAFVDQVQKRHLTEYPLERKGEHVGSVHWINSFACEANFREDEAIDSTWSEIEAGGPLINPIRGLLN